MGDSPYRQEAQESHPSLTQSPAGPARGLLPSQAPLVSPRRSYVVFLDGKVLHLRGRRKKHLGYESVCGLLGGSVVTPKNRGEKVQAIICKNCLRLVNA